MTNDRINIEYLTDYDFQLYVNKCCQSYHKTPEQVMASPITKEYCKSLQEGGCNYAGDKQRQDIPLATGSSR